MLAEEAAAAIVVLAGGGRKTTSAISKHALARVGKHGGANRGGGEALLGCCV